RPRWRHQVAQGADQAAVVGAQSRRPGRGGFALPRPDFFALTLAPVLTPARLLVRIDPEAQLAHELVSERRVRGLDPAQARAAQEPRDAGRGEEAEAAGELERQIPHLPGALDSPVLGRDDLERPRHAVVDAVRPIVREAIEVRADRLDLH